MSDRKLRESDTHCPRCGCVGNCCAEADKWHQQWVNAHNEMDRLREALERVVAQDGVEFVGTGRDRRGLLNGHRKCVEIAREALAKEGKR